jgi:hypothetical protein
MQVTARSDGTNRETNGKINAVPSGIKIGAGANGWNINYTGVEDRP